MRAAFALLLALLAVAAPSRGVLATEGRGDGDGDVDAPREPLRGGASAHIRDPPTEAECDEAVAALEARGLGREPLDAEVRAGGDPGPGAPDGLLFFLHVPRTAGRNLSHCLLRPAFAPSRRCPRSYDALRLRGGGGADGGRCDVSSSHDDLSALLSRRQELLGPRGLAVATGQSGGHPPRRPTPPPAPGTPSPPPP